VIRRTLLLVAERLAPDRFAVDRFAAPAVAFAAPAAFAAAAGARRRRVRFGAGEAEAAFGLRPRLGVCECRINSWRCVEHRSWERERLPTLNVTEVSAG